MRAVVNASVNARPLNDYKWESIDASARRVCVAYLSLFNHRAAFDTDAGEIGLIETLGAQCHAMTVRRPHIAFIITATNR